MAKKELRDAQREHKCSVGFFGVGGDDFTVDTQNLHKPELFVGGAKLSFSSESPATTGFDALRQARLVVSQFPDKGEALSNLANHLRRLGQSAEALSWCRWAVRPEAWPEAQVDPMAYRVQAEVLIDLGLFAKANDFFQLADPEGSSPEVQWSRSRALVGLEAWPEAWRNAEQRFQLEALPKAALPPPHWKGWPQAQSLVVWDEQGFGDSLQALRWIPISLQQIDHITVCVRSPLVRLLQIGLAWLGPQLRVCSRDEISCATFELSCHGSLLSLPKLLGCEELSPGHVLSLPKRSISFQRKKKIGLVWESGRYLDNPFNALEYQRKSLPPVVRERLRSAIETRGFSLVSLQLGDSAVPQEADFLQQAQALLDCQLLLTVDTAAAHLAGALDFPAWLMLPWSAASRWQRGRSKTPLYRSLKLFRQPRPGDWDGMLQMLLQNFDQISSSEAWLR